MFVQTFLCDSCESAIKDTDNQYSLRRTEGRTVEILKGPPRNFVATCYSHACSVECVRDLAGKLACEL